MSKFHDVLATLRRERGMSRSELAAAVQKSQQFVSALENEGAGRRPSIESLRDLIRVLTEAGDGRPLRAGQLKKAMELAFSALEVDYHLDFPASLKEELQYQSSVGQGDFWIVTDMFAENEGRDFANATVRNMIKNKSRYKFFIPFRIKEIDLDTFISNMISAFGEAVSGMEGEYWDLWDYLEVYKISNVAFFSRLRVANPRTEAAEGKYSLGGLSQQEVQFYPIPNRVLQQNLGSIESLLLRYKQKTESMGQEPTGPVGDYTEGYIQKCYPFRDILPLQ